VPADIAERGGAQQRIADGVNQGVAVGVAQGAPVKRNLHAAQNELAARHQAVEIVANADAGRIRNYEF